MKKSKAWFCLILTVVMIALMAFTAGHGWGKGTKGSAKNIKLGLDLAGGVSITYQTKDKNPSKTDMADTIYKLQKRVEQYSTEASVYQESSNRITIEIPGVTDANKVLEELGSPGELYFISQKGSDGNDNYSYNSETGKYELAEGKTIESLQEDGSIVLTGKEVSSAKAETTQDDMKNKQNIVSLKFNKEGTEAFATATTAASANGETIGIYYDGEFVSVPTVNEPITGGNAQISGGDMDKDMQIAKNLASYIRIGGLSLALEELRSNVVGAQLGENAIRTSLLAGLIGLILVFILMTIVYRLPGVISSIGLVIYTLLVLIILNAYDITLTLPGIAGIILGIGMAVDANVIIFARVKEEIGGGAKIDNALRAGFKKAFSAILDGNVTTLIAAIVLFILGSGSVKGFAQTLGIGILVSMFTALVAVRWIMYSVYTFGAKDKKFYGEKKMRDPYNFVGNMKKWFAIAGAVILAGFIVMFVNIGKKNNAFNYSLEFMGGTSTTVSFEKEYSLEEVDDQIIPVVEKITGDANVQAQKVKGSNDVVIKTRTLSLQEREKMEEDLAQFEYDADNETPVTTENISSTVSSEMRRDAVVALLVAIVCMLLYIFVRFRDIRFAFSSILALVHDVLIVVLFYAVSRISVGNTFIAAILTILGYSINATIVIFDRIREEMHMSITRETLANTVNQAITKTMTRSIYTSATTFIMIAVLYILGVSSIKEFALPLMVGIIAGGFSSIFISGSLWYLMKTKIGKGKVAL
ncbi:MAG: protein translocase subunit SecD [Lachnospiraceae bacterium]|nr:protein translocase subunit SecD [Lachnospiraceae bacterium]